MFKIVNIVTGEVRSEHSLLDYATQALAVFQTEPPTYEVVEVLDPEPPVE